MSEIEGRQPLMGKVAVAQRLGISVSSLSWLMQKGEAPRSLMVGKLRKWRPEDVEAWIAARIEAAIRRPPNNREARPRNGIGPLEIAYDDDTHTVRRTADSGRKGAP